MRNMICNLVLIACLLPFSSGQPIEPEDLLPYTDRGNGYRLAYPESWVPNHLDEASPFSIRNSNNKDLGVFSVNVLDPADLGTDVSQFMDDLAEDGGKHRLESSVERFGQAKLIDSSHTKLAGEPAFMTRVDYRHQALDLDVWIASIQLVAPHRGRIFVLTFESPTNTYDDNYIVFRRIVHSFLFLE